MRPGWIRPGIVVTAAIAACQFTHGNALVDGGSGSGTDAPFPDAGPCTAVGDSCGADGVTLEHCTAIGAIPTGTPCSWGCLGSGGAHCGVFTPAGGGVTGSDSGSAALGSWDAVTLGSATINSDDGTITGVPGGFGHGVRNGVTFFQFKQLTINGPVTLAGSNAIALVADGAIDIEGAIDARGPCTTAALTEGGTAGPGGFRGGAQHTDASGSGSGQTGGGTNTDGGGGGGYGGAGGDGGSNSNSGGPKFGSDLLRVLSGGGGGAGGGGGNGHAAPGGGGGGALQLVSNTSITIGASGSINAGGCGGYSTDSNDSAGGGGAGGAILLEAPAISIAGQLAVNGGGGGGGSDGLTELGMNKGQDGQLGRAPAFGCFGSSLTNGFGGQGGWGGQLDGSNGDAGTRGGGGGGGVGRMRFNTRALGSSFLAVDNSQLSPNLTDSPTTCTAGLADVQ